MDCGLLLLINSLLDEVPAPTILLQYGIAHTYVDAAKSITSRSKPKFRSKNHWRSRSNAMLVKLMHNCCIWFNHATGREDPLPLHMFILEAITELAEFKNPVKYQVPACVDDTEPHVLKYHLVDTGGMVKFNTQVLHSHFVTRNSSKMLHVWENNKTRVQRVP